ncbi:MAG: hypothetical protein KDM81_09995 [Verrucomicrobiae bacterium]|nr:hypothetical protein [Verrucomicrobiae bacterium]
MSASKKHVAADVSRRMLAFLVSAILATSTSFLVHAADLSRQIPEPLPDHPGNTFLAGEPVTVALPAQLPETATSWRLLDEADHELDRGTFGSTPPNRLDLGARTVGFYRIEFLDKEDGLLDWTSAAVLARLRAPTPLDSPVCLDLATSWFARDNPIDQSRFANLASLAGVNWVRDRMRWSEMEPEPGRFATHTTYDSAADIQHAAGLQVLQVFHDTPPWAREGRRGGEFATDLRHVFRFGQAMARRFKGRVQAWEPWNEANVSTFGSHTVDQICSWQKAAWLGFKAGDPGVTVGWNVTTTVPTVQQTTGILANEAWPYYDTYNIHTYDWAHSYLGLWEQARAATAGRPLWITESDRGLQHLGNAPWFDLSRHDERLKAEYIGQSYAQSFFAGSSRHFHFILGHYTESNGVQFSLLRKDFTPRAGYVALAAVGRFLAGAKVIGRWQPGNDITGILFRAQPDGEARDVLVVWAEKDVDWPQRGKTKAGLNLPDGLKPIAAFDYLGRSVEVPNELTSAPVYLLLPTGEGTKLPLENPPSMAADPGGVPCPIVLQAVFPSDQRVKVEDRPWSQGYAYGFEPGKPVSFKLRAYNFGDQPATGGIIATNLPAGWQLTRGAWHVSLPPGDLAEFDVEFRASEDGSTDDLCRLHGDFKGFGRPALAFRMKHSDTASQP